MKIVFILITCILLLLIFVFNPYTPVNVLQRSLNRRLHAKAKQPDLVIAVKTTRGYHRTRVAAIVESWFQLAPEETFIVTDTADQELNGTLRGHLINSHCPVGHEASALVCKMSRELRLFVETNAKWSCHFDDDNYVNVPQLKKLLLAMDETEKYYLGKISTADQVAVFDGPNMAPPFWFATGGAGICLSHAAVQAMAPRIADNGFRTLAARLRLPDDMTLGFLMANVLGIELTEVVSFHSHYEALGNIPVAELKYQAVLSGGSFRRPNDNVVDLPHLFDPNVDPFKFRTLHCFIFHVHCPKTAPELLRQRLRSTRYLV